MIMSSGTLTLYDSDIQAILKAAGVQQAITPTAPAPAPAPTRTGNLGGPGTFYVGISEVQSYLNQFFPGGVAEAGTGGWTGAYKIIRGPGGQYAQGSYFWTKTWQDIKRLY